MAAKTSLRRFVALVTGLGTKYRADPFFRTEVNIVALHVTFSIVILILVGISINYIYQDISIALTDGITKALTAQTPPTSVGVLITDELAKIKNQNLTMLIVLTSCITLMFGYIISRLTLAPARTALNSQKQFIGNIAHELRTPISIIKTNTEVTLLDEHVPKPLREMLESNTEELDRISDIINNLLSLSAFIRPERIEFTHVDIKKVTLGVIDKLATLTSKRGVILTSKNCEAGIVWANATGLEQIILNVVKNAVNHTPKGGTVDVSLRRIQDTSIEIVVADTGAGISKVDLQHVFEPFYRAERSRNRTKGGSGLGLAIVYELLKLHHGQIKIRSAPGRGTSVLVALPAKKNGASSLPHSHTPIKRDGFDEITVDFSS